MSRILDKAIELAYPAGTNKKKYAYKGGKPTGAFKQAFRKSFKKTSMKKAANCDRAASVVVRRALGEKFPTGNQEQLKYKPKKMTRHVHKNARPIDVAPPGAVVVIKKSNGKRHTLIMGNGVFYEATHNKTYFHTRTSLKKVRKKYPKVVVFIEK